MKPALALVLLCVFGCTQKQTPPPAQATKQVTTNAPITKARQLTAEEIRNQTPKSFGLPVKPNMSRLLITESGWQNSDPKTGKMGASGSATTNYGPDGKPISWTTRTNFPQ
jgi:hypothetical protein